MLPRFEFATASRILFGAGTVREAGVLAREFGPKALVVTGRDPRRAGPVLEALRAASVGVATFPVPGEPKLEDIQQGLAVARAEGCRVIVGFGGGSAIDAGKAIAAMLANPGELLDYLEVIGRGQPLSMPSAPFIAIPTTAGTGSEVTRNAVLASPQHRVKVSLRGFGMLPKVALVDPELTYALPPGLTASTGLDALTQLIEPYTCCRANPIVDALCVDGMSRIARSLRRAYAGGDAPSAREDMAMAGLFGGLALANAGLGAAHGFAGPIGGMFDAPHGAVCAALLPPVMAANVRALRERQPASPILARYDEVARILTGSPQAGVEDGLSWVRQLVRDLDVPPLSAYGMSVRDTSELVEKAAKASSMKANPLVLSPAELAGIFQAACAGSLSP